MKHLDAEHLTLLNTVLSRTEEFIDFFDRAETKMTTWRHEIAQQAHFQQEKLQEFKGEIERVELMITQANADDFHIAAEDTTARDSAYLDSLKHTEQQLLRQIHGHRAELTRITQHAMTQISQTTAQAVSVIEEKLSIHLSSSVPNMMPFSNQSLVDNIGDHADESIQEDAPFSKPREWRSVALTLVTTVITAVIFGMYTSNEYPWEIHQQAISERGAGKVLMNAWPSLTHEEKNKILYRAS